MAEQAKILVAEVEENNLDVKARNEKGWSRWENCGLCEQEYHGVVRCALGWACWKTYLGGKLGRPEAANVQWSAMAALSNGLGAARRNEERLGVLEAQLEAAKRLHNSEAVLFTLSNISNCYILMKRPEEAIGVTRDVYERSLALWGANDMGTMSNGFNLASSLIEQKIFGEAREFLCARIIEAQRALGPTHDMTLAHRRLFARALYGPEDASLADCREAAEILEADEKASRCLLGADHPSTARYVVLLHNSRHCRDQLLTSH